MWDLIKEIGFINYMRTYPLNPISLILSVVVIGTIVLTVNAKVKKKRAKLYLKENPNATILVFGKQHVGHTDYGDNIRIVNLNEQKAHWFFYKPQVPAIYINEGTNTIELYTEWARKSGPVIKQYKSPVTSIKIDIEQDKIYYLSYCISVLY